MPEFDGEDKVYPYRVVFQEGNEVVMSSRFWNNRSNQIGIVARVNRGIDWAAYIGTDGPNSWREYDTQVYVACYGEKLMEVDAKHFFPEISLLYRY